MSPSLGVCAAVFGDLPLVEALPLVRAAGFDTIDLPTDSTFQLLGSLEDLEEPAYHDRIAAIVETSGLHVGCVSNSRDTQLILGPHGRHTDGIAMGTPAAKREYALRYARATIALAHRLGAAQARLFFGCPDFALWLRWTGSTASWEDNLHAFVEEARPLLDLARQRGVQLCVEPHPKQVLYDPPSARRAIELLADYHDSFRLCIDPANVATLGYDPVASLRGWGGWLGAVHAKDLERWRGTDMPPDVGWVPYGPQPPVRFRTVGWGDLPWPAMITAMLDESFGGVLYVEHEDVLIAREDGLRQAYDRLTSMIPTCPPQGRTW